MTIIPSSPNLMTLLVRKHGAAASYPHPYDATLRPAPGQRSLLVAALPLPPHRCAVAPWALFTLDPRYLSRVNVVLLSLSVEARGS